MGIVGRIVQYGNNLLYGTGRTTSAGKLLVEGFQPHHGEGVPPGGMCTLPLPGLAISASPTRAKIKSPLRVIGFQTFQGGEVSTPQVPPFSTLTEIYDEWHSPVRHIF